MRPTTATRFALVAAFLFGQDGRGEGPRLVAPEPAFLATLSVGSAAWPLGPMASVGAVYAGDEGGLNVWRLEGPLSRPTGRASVATAGLIGQASSSPLTGVLALHAGHLAGHWTIVDPDKVESISRSVLEWVTDETAIPSPLADDLEADAYTRVLALAAQTSAAGFAREANRELTYSDVFRRPKLHRGEVFHYEGRLKRVRKLEVPLMAQQAGVRSLYEGWVFSDLYGANPVCVLFADLPEGLEVKEQTEVRVELDGYFFKKYRYKAADGWRDAPLVMARTLRVVSKPGEVAEETESWGRALLPAFMGTLAGVAAVLVGMVCWFKRADRRVQGRMREAAARPFVDPSESPYPDSRESGERPSWLERS